MSVSKVRSALIQGFETAALFTKENTAYQNVGFTPKDAPWCRVTYMPGIPVVSTLGSGGTDRLDGFIQFDLNYPLNTGEKAVGDKADAFRNTFTTGSRFLYSGQTVVVSSCGRSPGREIDGFFRVVVSVFFYAYITRN